MYLDAYLCVFMLVYESFNSNSFSDLVTDLVTQEGNGYRSKPIESQIKHS